MDTLLKTLKRARFGLVRPFGLILPSKPYARPALAALLPFRRIPSC